MANTRRRAEYIDRNNNMFIPMNVEGGSWNDSFFSTTKLVTLAAIIFIYGFLIMYLGSSMAKPLGYVIYLGVWTIISILLLRFIVFEEKFYYKMYLELKDFEISSPALFWDIASIKETDEGAIMTYSDAKIGILVKVDRDTITGKTPEFKEMHYDAISDFYREVVNNRYSFVQMNIMEAAGKDPRLNELSKVVYKNKNNNIRKLMEMQVGHIKNITRSSLYESDYFLFYTADLSKVDCIIGDISEYLFKLLDGAYIGYRILSSKDIVDFIKEQYGVNYFNSAEASLMMFNRNAGNVTTPFIINSLLWTDGEKQELTNNEINRLRNITSSVIRETTNQKDVSLKDTIYRKEIKNKMGVDFSSLSEVSFGNKGNKNILSKNTPTDAKPKPVRPQTTPVRNNGTSNQLQQNSGTNPSEDYIDL